MTPEQQQFYERWINERAGGERLFKAVSDRSGIFLDYACQTLQKSDGISSGNGDLIPSLVLAGNGDGQIWMADYGIPEKNPRHKVVTRVKNGLAVVTSVSSRAEPDYVSILRHPKGYQKETFQNLTALKYLFPEVIEERIWGTAVLGGSEELLAPLPEFVTTFMYRMGALDRIYQDYIVKSIPHAKTPDMLISLVITRSELTLGGINADVFVGGSQLDTSHPATGNLVDGLAHVTQYFTPGHDWDTDDLLSGKALSENIIKECLGGYFKD